MDGYGPIVGYYLAKRREIKSVRIALACIKNKVSKDIMKERLTRVYAE